MLLLFKSVSIDAQPVPAIYLGAGFQYVTTGVPVAGGEAEWIIPVKRNAVTFTGGVYVTRWDKGSGREDATFFPLSANFRAVFKQNNKGYFQVGAGPLLNLGETVVTVNLSIGSANAVKPGLDASGIVKIGGSGYYFIGARLAYGFSLKK